MAIFHLAARVGSRGGGQSAAAAFAYLCQKGRYGRERGDFLDGQKLGERGQLLDNGERGDQRGHGEGRDLPERGDSQERQDFLDFLERRGFRRGQKLAEHGQKLDGGELV